MPTLADLFRLDPNVERLTLLPRLRGTLPSDPGYELKGSVMGERYMPDIIAPKVLYDFIRAVKAPARAARGEELDEEEALNTAMNIMGGGLATSGGTPAGALGMAIKGKISANIPLKKVAETSQEIRLREAQEAAKKLGLSPNRQVRMRELGYEPGWYHGTIKDITEFEPGKRGATFLTRSTDFANDFAPSEAIGLGKELSTQPNVMPVSVKVSNPFDYENPEHIKAVMTAAKLPKTINRQVAQDNLELGNWAFIEDKNIQQAIKNLGFDGFYIKEHGLKNLGIFNPSQIRSKFAAFDPTKVNESNVLAAGNPYALPVSGVAGQDNDPLMRFLTELAGDPLEMFVGLQGK